MSINLRNVECIIVEINFWV